MSKINFYKKQTVLNNILKAPNVTIVDNSQLSYMSHLLSDNNFIYTHNLTKSYPITYNMDIDTVPIIDFTKSNNWLTHLYKEQYNISPTTNNNEIINNIKKFNNVCYINGSYTQISNYYSYNTIINANTILLDSTYNVLYYIQNDKINLMSYNISISNGFNYKNHMLYFDIDNKYIKSVNNTLYYNYNKASKVNENKIGVAKINDDYFDVKNSYYYDNTLYINKKLKTDIFVSLNQLKELYHNCSSIYNTLSYYNNIDDYSFKYFEFDKFSNPETKESFVNINEIIFNDSDLYFSDNSIGINNVNINNLDTIYINNLANIRFRVGNNNINLNKNITSHTYDRLLNNISLNAYCTDNININVSYTNMYKYINISSYYNFIESSQAVFENYTISYINKQLINKLIKYPLSTTYHLNIKLNSDKEIFNKNGCTIEYIDRPYYNYIDDNASSIILHNKKTINIRKINGTVKNYAKTATLSTYKNLIIPRYDIPINTTCYYILSSVDLGNFSFNGYEILQEYKDNPPGLYYYDGRLVFKTQHYQEGRYVIKLNENLFNLLMDRNLITSNNQMYYYILNNNEITECYPSLNIYPSKYINSKFFKSELFSEDRNLIINEELDTCISDVKYLLSNTLNNVLFVYTIYKYQDQSDYYLHFFKRPSSMGYSNVYIEFKYNKPKQKYLDYIGNQYLWWNQNIIDQSIILPDINHSIVPEIIDDHTLDNDDLPIKPSPIRPSDEIFD